jgi:hypothetical protein
MGRAGGGQLLWLVMGRAGGGQLLWLVLGRAGGGQLLWLVMGRAGGGQDTRICMLLDLKNSELEEHCSRSKSTVCNSLSWMLITMTVLPRKINT